MEFDSVSNRYYPIEYLKQLRKQRASASPGSEPEVGDTGRSFGNVRIIQSQYEHVLLAPQYNSFGISNRLVYQIKLQPKKSQNGFPTFTTIADPQTHLHNLSHKPSIRDCILTDTKVWCCGDGGLWCTDGSVVAIGDNLQEAINQLHVDCDGNVLFCSSDTVGLIGKDGVITSDGNGFRSIVPLADTILVSATNGRLLFFHKQRLSVIKQQTINLVFKKMVAMSDNNTILALAFSNDLYILDCTDNNTLVTVMGVLCGGVTHFCTDHRQLVLVRQDTGHYTLFNLSDPSDRLFSLKSGADCTDLQYTDTDGRFSVILKI